VLKVVSVVELALEEVDWVPCGLVEVVPETVAPGELEVAGLDVVLEVMVVPGGSEFVDGEVLGAGGDVVTPLRDGPDVG